MKEEVFQGFILVNIANRGWVLQTNFLSRVKNVSPAVSSHLIRSKQLIKSSIYKERPRVGRTQSMFKVTGR